MTEHTSTPASAPEKHKAGAFDIRTVIAILLEIYGLVLVICSFALDPGTNPDTGASKSATDNLWVGIGLLVVAGVFVAWTKLKPIIVDESKIVHDDEPGLG